MTSNSLAFLHASSLAPSNLALSKIFTNLASRSSRMKAGVARNLPAATIVSQHLAANSADVHFSSQAFSTTGASVVVLTILISGFLGASSMVVSATACVASATAASVACDALWWLRWLRGSVLSRPRPSSHCFGSPYCFGSPCSLALSRLNLFTTLQGHGVLDDCSHFRSKRLAVRLTPSLFCSASGLAHELPKPPRKRVRRLQASFHAPPRRPCVRFTAVKAPFG